MPIVRQIFVALVVGWAASVAIVTPASAQPPRFFGCVLLTGVGGFSNSGCTLQQDGGMWARSDFIVGQRKIRVCLFVGAGVGVYNDPNCSAVGGTKKYQIFDPPNVNSKAKGGTFTFTTVGTEVTCVKMSGKEFLIEGGEPGEAVAAALEYSECSVAKPEHCTVHPIATQPVLLELVEDTKRELIEALTKPKSGTTLANVEFLNQGGTCSIAGSQVIEGTALGKIGKEEGAKEKTELKYTNGNTEYLDSKGKKGTAGLTLAGIKMNFKGTMTLEAEVEAGKLKDEGGEEHEISSEKVLVGEEK